MSARFLKGEARSDWSSVAEAYEKDTGLRGVHGARSDCVAGVMNYRERVQGKFRREVAEASLSLCANCSQVSCWSDTRTWPECVGLRHRDGGGCVDFELVIGSSAGELPTVRSDTHAVEAVTAFM